MKFYLFGAGKYGKLFIEKNGKSDIIAFIDNDSSKQSSKKKGENEIPVLSYAEFKEVFNPEAERIIITCNSDTAIYKQLHDDGFATYVAGFSKAGLPAMNYTLFNSYINLLGINITERLPTHKDKECIINEFISQFGKKVLVETGTYLGATVTAFKDKVDWMSSVEVKKELYEDVVEKFKDCSNVHLYLGDSSDLLPRMISDIPDNIRNQTIFFLDGHWSQGITGKGKKDTPILEEVKIIRDFYPSDVIILIDDARLFKHGGTEVYPDYLELHAVLKQLWPKAIVFRECDIIHVIIPA